MVHKLLDISTALLNNKVQSPSTAKEMMDEFTQLLEKYSFEANSLPSHIALNAKRNQLLLSQKYAAHRKPEWLASLELEGQLAEYSRLVDDRKGVNNFASTTLELCSKLRKDCKGWKSSLNCASPPNLEELLKETHYACSNPSKDGCTADLPTDEELENFRKFKPQANQGFEVHSATSTSREDKHELYGDVFTFGNAVATAKTPLAPHFSSSNPVRQPPANHRNQPQIDSRQSGFVAKRPQSSSGPYGVDRDFPNSHRSSTVGPQRNLGEPKLDGFTEYPSGGGIYTSLVGGRFKKWGGKDKLADVTENDENASSSGYQNGGLFGGKPRSHQRSLPGDDFVAPPDGLSSFKTAGEQLKVTVHRKLGGYGSYGGNVAEGSRTNYGGNSFEGSHNNYAGRSLGSGHNAPGYSCFGVGGRGGHGNSSFASGVEGSSSLFSGGGGGQGGYGNSTYHPIRSIKKSLGGKGVVNNRFVPPMRSNVEKRELGEPNASNLLGEEEEVDERLKNIEPRMIELIKNEIMDCGSKITWDDIAGLHFAKNTIQEIVVWPMLRPDIFTGLRRPPKGILLFGPPGTGKTLIGKCIASQSGSTFFSISASSLTSKWIGEGEKMVRALFAVARVHQPAVVFIDEIDSLLSQRSETEHESSRRIKTEFLVQLDGAGTDEEDRLLVIGATNRPQELDEAARRRLVKRLYIPLPDVEARKEIVVKLMKCEPNDLTELEIDELAQSTEGFSGADMKHLCQEACLGPIRSLGPSQISSIAASQVRPVSMTDFTSALKRVHPSVGQEDLHQYVAWNKTYGSGS